MAASTSYRALPALDVSAMPGEPGAFPAPLNRATWSNPLHRQQIRVESAGRLLM